MANPKARMILNGRPSYQGKKQITALDLCPMGRRRTFVDVGGHCGTWSFNFAHWFKNVEAFEPVAEHRECWEKNLQATPAGHTAKLWPCALGERGAMVSIRTEATSTGDSRVDGVGKIEMKTLDSFDLPDVDLIKLDTEGYEEFVLRGAVETIKKWKPVIVVEQKRDMAMRFNLKPLGAVVFLKGLGYKSANEISGDFFMVPA